MLLLVKVGGILVRGVPNMVIINVLLFKKLGEQGFLLDNFGKLIMLYGLVGLKMLEGLVDIRNNCMLVDVLVFKGVKIVNGVFQIIDNVVLIDVQGLVVKDVIGFENILGGIFVFGNSGIGVCFVLEFILDDE